MLAHSEGLIHVVIIFPVRVWQNPANFRWFYELIRIKKANLPNPHTKTVRACRHPHSLSSAAHDPGRACTTIAVLQQSPRFVDSSWCSSARASTTQQGHLHPVQPPQKARRHHRVESWRNLANGPDFDRLQLLGHTDIRIMRLASSPPRLTQAERPTLQSQQKGERKKVEIKPEHPSLASSGANHG